MLINESGSSTRRPAFVYKQSFLFPLITCLKTLIYQPLSAVCGSSSQFITAIVEGIGGVAFHPGKLYLLSFVSWDEALPEVFVLFIFEPDLYPVPEPAFFNRIDYILTVSEDADRQPVFFERFKCDDNRQQFHAVVGGFAVSLGEFFANGVPHEDNAIATWPRITAG